MVVTIGGKVDAQLCLHDCYNRWTVVSGDNLIQPWDVFGGGGPQFNNAVEVNLDFQSNGKWICSNPQ